MSFYDRVGDGIQSDGLGVYCNSDPRTEVKQATIGSYLKFNTGPNRGLTLDFTDAVWLIPVHPDPDRNFFGETFIASDVIVVAEARHDNNDRRDLQNMTVGEVNENGFLRIRFSTKRKETSTLRFGPGDAASCDPVRITRVSPTEWEIETFVENGLGARLKQTTPEGPVETGRYNMPVKILVYEEP